MTRTVTAAVLLIGDELLSGRTRDINLQQIGQFLAPVGIDVAEARVVRDDRDQIVDALNTLRAAHDYVFTTGGIGPTHDDITADCVAAAFGVSIDIRDDALAILEEWYAKSDADLTDARRRMARIPDGAALIANPVTGAPGFQLENVFVMAGVPKIMRGMLEDVAGRLEGGTETQSVTVPAEGLREGDIAAALGEIQQDFEAVSLGSYPYFNDDGTRGVNIVARSRDADALHDAEAALRRLVDTQGRSAS